MRVLIISDSHGKSLYLEKAILRVSPMDCIIHLGDIEGDEDYLRDISPCPVYMVAGNNDFFSREPKEDIIQLGKYRILLTHGHKYNIYGSAEGLKTIGKQRGVDIVMYGHTHVPNVDQTDDVWLINPGSISLPRQKGRRPSYILMELDANETAHFHVNYFEA